MTFIAGLFYGAAGYFLLGLALWVGAKAAGVEARFRIARQIVAFAAVPFVLSLVVVLPAIALRYGWDWFRTGGEDAGTGRDVVVGIGLAFAAWSLVLVALGLRDHLPASVARRGRGTPARGRDRRSVRRAADGSLSLTPAARG